jgi:hypothetical protein
MWIDPIVEETRALRAGVAAVHGNNLREFGRYLMAQQAMNAAKELPSKIIKRVTRTQPRKLTPA